MDAESPVNSGREKKVTCTCMQCKKEFKAYPYKVALKEAKFCSRGCHHQYRRDKEDLVKRERPRQSANTRYLDEKIARIHAIVNRTA